MISIQIIAKNKISVLLVYFQFKNSNPFPRIPFQIIAKISDLQGKNFVDKRTHIGITHDRCAGLQSAAKEVAVAGAKQLVSGRRT